jgi:hypothetical protein
VVITFPRATLTAPDCTFTDQRFTLQGDVARVRDHRGTVVWEAIIAPGGAARITAKRLELLLQSGVAVTVTKTCGCGASGR